MSQQQRIKIPRSADKSIAEAYRELGRKYGIAQANVSALGFNSLGSVSLTAEADGAWKVLLDHDSYLIDSMSFQVGGFSIAYYRGGQQEPKSPIYDEIVLTQNSQQPTDTKDKLDIVAFLNKHLRPFEPDRIIGGEISEEQNQLLAIHNNTLERLEQLNEDLIRQGSEFRHNLEEKFDNKVHQYEQELRAKEDQFEADFKSRVSQLENKELTLDERIKAFDDRDNTHVRREIRDKMLDDVRQRINKFGVSESTETKRKPVLYGIFLLAAVLGVLLVWTVYEISSLDAQYVSSLKAFHNLPLTDPEGAKTATPPAVDKANLYWLWARFTILSLGIAGTLLYYVKWQNKWAEQHASSEFQLQQFYIDVNRANWVIESCLEWRKETQSVIPKELLASITNGLFVNKQADVERVIHPADELASALMGSASKLKLNLGGNEVEIDKPRKITKEIISGSP